MRTSRIVSVLAAAATLVVALPGVANAATYQYRYDDGSMETSLLVDRYNDYSYRWFDIQGGTVEAATSAKVWAYGKATDCDGTPAETKRLYAWGKRLQFVDPCALWPTTDYAWASLDLPLSALFEGHNYVMLGEEYPDTHADRNMYLGIDTGSSGHSRIIDNGNSGAEIAGEIMTYIVLYGTAPAMSATPTTLPFGLVLPDTTSVPRTITVTSTGFAPLDVTGLAVTGANASEFTIVSDGCTGATVPVGDSCRVDVTFSPTAKGSRYATLTVSGSGGAADTAVLYGEGQSDPPVSVFETAGPVLPRVQRIRGTVTDDLGLAYEYLRFTPVAAGLPVVTQQADVTCNADRTACDWSMSPLAMLPGLYTITAHGVDSQGVVESPGPTITAVVV